MNALLCRHYSHRCPAPASSASALPMRDAMPSRLAVACRRSSWELPVETVYRPSGERGATGAPLASRLTTCCVRSSTRKAALPSLAVTASTSRAPPDARPPRRRLHLDARLLPPGLLRRRARRLPLPPLQGRQPAREAAALRLLSARSHAGANVKCMSLYLGLDIVLPGAFFLNY